MKHASDGSGKYILSWMWELQFDNVHKVERMGWTYWLLYNNLEDAKEFLETYVKPRFHNVLYQITEYNGNRESFFTGPAS